MGVKICPECGGKVAEARTTCPHCGYEFKEKINCPDCDELIDANVEECPICGHEFVKVNHSVTNVVNNEPKMVSIKCPSCGSSDCSEEEDGAYSCNSCNTRFKMTEGNTTIINNVNVEPKSEKIDLVHPNQIIVLKTNISKDDFMQEALRLLKDSSETPDDIFDCEFGEISLEYRDVYYGMGTADINYSRSVGYKREEKYIDTESKSVSAGERYTYHGAPFIASKSEWVKMDVEKTRTVTDWVPDSGRISAEGTSVKILDMSSGIEQSSLERNIASAMHSFDVREYCEEILSYSVDPMEEATVKKRILRNVYYNHVPMKGDDTKDESYNGLVTITGAVVTRFPLYKMTITYKDSHYVILGTALGRATACFLLNPVFPNTNLDNRKERIIKHYKVLGTVFGIVALLCFLVGPVVGGILMSNDGALGGSLLGVGIGIGIILVLLLKLMQVISDKKCDRLDSIISKLKLIAFKAKMDEFGFKMTDSEEEEYRDIEKKIGSLNSFRERSSKNGNASLMNIPEGEKPLGKMAKLNQVSILKPRNFFIFSTVPILFIIIGILCLFAYETKYGASLRTGADLIHGSPFPFIFYPCLGGLIILFILCIFKKIPNLIKIIYGIWPTLLLFILGILLMTGLCTQSYDYNGFVVQLKHCISGGIFLILASLCMFAMFIVSFICVHNAKLDGKINKLCDKIIHLPIFIIHKIKSLTKKGKIIFASVSVGVVLFITVFLIVFLCTFIKTPKGCKYLEGGGIYITSDCEGDLVIPSYDHYKKITYIECESYDSKIRSVTIPDTVTEIGDHAFYGCRYLTTITIPDSVTEIGSYAFYLCDSLTTITIPDSVTSIGKCAFLCCSSLTSVTIPDSVTSIGEGTFDDCSSLTSITIPDSVTEIGDHAFYDCSSLTSITIPDSVTEIGTSAFYGCSNLTSITIPDSVTEIEEYAFSGCSSLTTITIPDSVTSIDYKAFYGCSSLTSIIIPDSVTSIGEDAFYGCSSLTSITLPFIGKNLTSNGYLSYIFGGDSYNENGDYVPSSLKTVILSDKCTKIDDYAFSGCTGLISIKIPDSVTSIGYEAFYGCSSLTSITIPDSVTSIGQCAFLGCSSLTSITIPDSVTSIGYEAFYGCNNLTSITLPFISSDWISNEYFGYIFGARNYSENDDYVPSSLKTVIFSNKCTKITDYAFSECTSLISITISDSVNEIGDHAFYGCSSLTSITIPDSVTSIGEGAFCDCSSLTSITISDSVSEIGDYAFYGCSSLTSITIPDSVTRIYYKVFYGCSSLTSITIPDSVTSIGQCAFYGCSSLKKIEYDGYKSQWDAIYFGRDWNYGTGNYTVYCMDDIFTK